MARFTADEMDNYSSNGGGSYFSLKDDKDTATVRFMYETMDQVEGVAVHEIEIGDKRKFVNCLRAYNEPVDSCPLCAAGIKIQAKLFIPLYDIDSDSVKFWVRGKTFLSKLSSLFCRYTPLVSTPFEIERIGEKGSTSTRYETYPMQSDDTRLEDLPEIPDVLGDLVLDKSEDELNNYLDTGNFETAPPVRRNPAKDTHAAPPAAPAAAPARNNIPANNNAPRTAARGQQSGSRRQPF